MVELVVTVVEKIIANNGKVNDLACLGDINMLVTLEVRSEI